jgi:tetratricopeptide (TPR) repeat protein
MLLGATGILAIAALGVLFLQNREPEVGTVPSVPGISQPSNSENVNFQTADTSKVTNIAIEQLSQGNIAAGQKAVEELLNRGALQPASAALAVVPKAQLDNHTVSFLRGRLAWQSVQVGSDNYDLQDARRYWETALKAQPKSFTYLNALGFAYYAEGDFDRANQAWFDALYLMEEAKAAANGSNVSGDTAKKDALTTYAGLALGLWKSAQKQPADKRTSLLNESLKLRQKVMTDDPVNFQPEGLGKNWLWSEKAIQDWRSLLETSK